MIDPLHHYISESIPSFGKEKMTSRQRLRAFETAPKLVEKVGSNRDFKPFYGNTTVFLLDDQVKATLGRLQQELYDGAGWLLSRRLEPETFHMTLHDLANGPEKNAALERAMARAEAGTRPLLEQWRDLPPLRMQTTWLFNMVNTSIVLGLEPADARSWKQLDGMYMALEQVVPLGHAMTPHITMAYYRPDVYTVYDRHCLKKALHPVQLELTLKMEDLVLQEFTDMNHYRNL